MEEKLKLRQNDLKAAQLVAKQGFKAENMSAEMIAEVRKRLTQYFIDAKYDEVEASAMTLKLMGMNEETYAKLVADGAKANALNIDESNF
jgi:hypothetical protein